VCVGFWAARRALRALLACCRASFKAAIVVRRHLQQTTGCRDGCDLLLVDATHHQRATDVVLWAFLGGRIRRGISPTIAPRSQSGHLQSGASSHSVVQQVHAIGSRFSLLHACHTAPCLGFVSTRVACGLISTCSPRSSAGKHHHRGHDEWW